MWSNSGPLHLKNKQQISADKYKKLHSGFSICVDPVLCKQLKLLASTKSIIGPLIFLATAMSRLLFLLFLSNNYDKQKIPTMHTC